MYTTFFGLSRDPFSLTSDPSFLYFTPQNRDVFAGLAYAMSARRGLVVLTGEAGTGKTTLLGMVLRSLSPQSVQSSLILNPAVTPDDFLELMLTDFGITKIPPGKAQRIIALNRFLLEGAGQKKMSVLIVDEAHKLDPQILEEIRLLSNFERPGEKLLQIVLAGQPELDDVLKREDLRQFKQRITSRLSTKPLLPEQIAPYVRHRWAVAGGSAPPFDSDSLLSIGKWSRGIPRVVNVICDNALLAAFGEGKTLVNTAHVREVCIELDLDSPEPKIATAPVQANNVPAQAHNAENQGPVAGTALIRRLERYGDTPAKRTFVNRWASRLGFAQGHDL